MGRYGTPDLGTGKNTETEFYKCKKCGQEFYKTWNHCPACRTPKGKGQVRPILWIILALVIIFAGYEKFYIPNEKAEIDIKPSTKTEVNEDATLTFSSIPVESPPTGIYQLFTNDDLLAPFKIKHHADEYCYLIKFIEMNNQSTVLTIFLNSYEDCNVNVPLEIYEITIASGKIWYGTEDLFGPSTQYKKFDKTYEFYKDNTGYRGWIIDLKPNINGNLKTNYINKDAFM